MKIKGMFNLTSTNACEFYNQLRKNIDDLQADGQVVDVQYKVNNFPNGQLAYSALIIGRKDED